MYFYNNKERQSSLVSQLHSFSLCLTICFVTCSFRARNTLNFLQDYRLQNITHNCSPLSNSFDHFIALLPTRSHHSTPEPIASLYPVRNPLSLLSHFCPLCPSCVSMVAPQDNKKDNHLFKRRSSVSQFFYLRRIYGVP